MAISSSSTSSASCVPSSLQSFRLFPSPSISVPLHRHRHRHRHRRSLPLSPLCKQQRRKEPKERKDQRTTSLAKIAPPPPPANADDAVFQAGNTIAFFLDKSLRSSSSIGALPVRRRKLQKQARFQVELPLLQETDAARASLLLDLISSLSIGEAGRPLSSCAVFCNGTVMEAVSDLRNLSPSPSPNPNPNPNPGRVLRGSDYSRTFQNPRIQFCIIASDIVADLQEAQFVVIFSPNRAQRAAIEKITEASDPRPIVLINPDWTSIGAAQGQGEEGNGSSAESFLESFEVIYSYLPLLIQGFFSKTEGAVVKQSMANVSASSASASASAASAAASSSTLRWFIYVKEGDSMRCVSSLARRPSAEDLENALYNAMAASSPLTRSIKFFKGMFTGNR